MQTEGDAFQVVFHSAGMPAVLRSTQDACSRCSHPYVLPADALAWCCATQQALLAANWPRKLESHPCTCLRVHEEMEMLYQSGAFANRNSYESVQSSDARLYSSPSCVKRILDRRAPSKSTYHVEPSQRPLSICQASLACIELVTSLTCTAAMRAELAVHAEFPSPGPLLGPQCQDGSDNRHC